MEGGWLQVGSSNFCEKYLTLIGHCSSKLIHFSLSFLSVNGKVKNIFTICIFQLQEAPSPPKAVFFSCIDSRLQPSAFTSTSPGDMFIGKLNLDHLV